MPNRVDLQLSHNKGLSRNFYRGNGRRRLVLGLAAAASLRLIAACDNSGSSGNNLDMSGSAGDGGSGGPDLSLPIDPPPGSDRVTVTIGTGMGTVTSQPAPINCGNGNLVCAADFTDMSKVVLTAAGATGQVFTGWTGACAGQGAVCTLTLTGNVNITANFGTQSCTPDGVCWEAPLPFGYDFNAVYALAANNVWAVGDAGILAHYDGTTWSRVTSPTNQDLFDVWARAANDVWVAAGNGGLTLHYDGTNWTKVPTGFAADVATRVWASPGRVIVSVNSNVLISTNNGTTWTKQSVSTRADSGPGSLGGTGDTDSWVLSFDRHISHGPTYPVVRPASNIGFDSITAVWSVSATDAYAITDPGVLLRASAGFNAGSGTLGWAAGSPVINGGFNFRSLWGTSATSLFTAGPAATMYKYNGTAWTAVPTGIKDTDHLNKIHGTTATDVWAVGPHGILAHYDGANVATNRANVFGLGSSAGGASDLVTVWASGPTDAYFATKAATIVHYNGAGFTEQKPTPLVGKGGSHIYSIWGSGPGDVWAAGDDGSNAIIMHTTDGNTWTASTQDPVISINNFKINALYAASKTSAFAACDPATTIEHWDGTQWKVQSLAGQTYPIIALWGSSDAQVFAIEPTLNKLWVYNGAAWTVDPRITAGTALYSLGGSSATDAWAGGSKSVWRFDGAMWTQKAIAAAAGNIISVTSSSMNDVWATDQSGVTFHSTNAGASWTTTDIAISSSGSPQMHVYSVSPQLTWIAGRGILSVRH